MNMIVFYIYVYGFNVVMLTHLYTMDLTCNVLITRQNRWLGKRLQLLA